MLSKLCKSDKKTSKRDIENNLSSDSDDEHNGVYEMGTKFTSLDETDCESVTDSERSLDEISSNHKAHETLGHTDLKHPGRDYLHITSHASSSSLATSVCISQLDNDGVETKDNPQSLKDTKRLSERAGASLLRAFNDKYAAQKEQHREENVASKRLYYPLKAVENHTNLKELYEKDFQPSERTCDSDEAASDAESIDSNDFDRRVESVENLLSELDEFAKKVPGTINNILESKFEILDKPHTAISPPMDFDPTELDTLKQNPAKHTYYIDYIIVQDPINSCMQLAEHGLVCMQGMQLPYIYRGGYKFCPLSVVNQSYWNKMRIFRTLSCMSNCIQIPTVTATANELATLKYMGYEDTNFLQNLVRLCAAKQFYDFLRHCILRAYGVGGVSHPFGFIAVAGQIMPYVKIGEDKFIPTSFLMRSYAEIKWSSDALLLNWKLAYIKYACRYAGFAEVVQNDFVLASADLLQLMEQLPEEIAVNCNVWPKFCEGFKSHEIVKENFPVWTAEPNELFIRNVANSIVDYACWQLQVSHET